MNADRWFAVGLAVLMAAVVVFFATRMSVEPVDSKAAARRWADSLGMRITGATCEHHRCAVAPEQGPPFVIYCNAESCSLPERQP